MSNAAGGIQVDEWPKQVNTVALRNKTYPRRWGMMVTVITDPTPANNTTWVLVYNLVDTNKNNNANWQTLANYAGGGSGGGSKITILNTDVTDAGNVNAAETTVYSYNLAGGTLDTDLQSVYGKSAGSFTGSADNLQMKMKLGGVTFFDSDVFLSFVNSSWVLDWEIIRVDANTQRCWARLVTDIGGNNFTQYTELTQDLTTNLALIITAQGAVSNEIVCSMTKLFKEDI
jgi:hypothetical protein